MPCDLAHDAVFKSAWLSDFGEACVPFQNSEDGQQFSGNELCQPSSLEAEKRFPGSQGTITAHTAGHSVVLPTQDQPNWRRRILLRADAVRPKQKTTWVQQRSLALH